MNTRIVKNPLCSVDRWHDTLGEVLAELYEPTAELGGTIYGEHGIGNKRKEFMPLCVREPYIDMMRAIKRALDPNNILNPGKIFDM